MAHPADYMDHVRDVFEPIFNAQNDLPGPMHATLRAHLPALRELGARSEQSPMYQESAARREDTYAHAKKEAAEHDWPLPYAVLFHIAGKLAQTHNSILISGVFILCTPLLVRALDETPAC